MGTIVKPHLTAATGHGFLIANKANMEKIFGMQPVLSKLVHPCNTLYVFGFSIVNPAVTDYSWSAFLVRLDTSKMGSRKDWTPAR